MSNSFCLPSKCKVKRLSFFEELEKWHREEGLSFNEIYRRCKERDPENCPSVPTVADHFNRHYAPIAEDLKTFSPERMAKELDNNIAECSRRIKLLGDDPNEMRLVAQLMDTQKKLLELKLQNQQMFLEREKTLPEQFDNLKKELEDLPDVYVEKILTALERDIYGR